MSADLARQYEDMGVSYTAGAEQDPMYLASRFHYVFSPALVISTGDRNVGIDEIPVGKIVLIRNKTYTKRSEDTELEPGTLVREMKYAMQIAEELNKAYSNTGFTVIWSLAGVPPQMKDQIERDLLGGYRGDRATDLYKYLSTVVDLKSDLHLRVHQELMEATARALNFCEEYYAAEKNKLSDTARTGKGITRASPIMKRVAYQINKPVPQDLEDQIERIRSQHAQAGLLGQSVGDGIERTQCGWCASSLPLFKGKPAPFNLPVVCGTCGRNPREAPQDETHEIPVPAPAGIVRVQQQGATVTPDGSGQELLTERLDAHLMIEEGKLQTISEKAKSEEAFPDPTPAATSAPARNRKNQSLVNKPDSQQPKVS